MKDTEGTYVGLPEPMQPAARTYLTNLKITVLLTEIIRQLEAVASGCKPDTRALAGIRRGIDDIRQENDKLLASLGVGHGAAEPAAHTRQEYCDPVTAAPAASPGKQSVFPVSALTTAFRWPR